MRARACGRPSSAGAARASRGLAGRLRLSPLSGGALRKVSGCCAVRDHSRVRATGASESLARPSRSRLRATGLSEPLARPSRFRATCFSEPLVRVARAPESLVRPSRVLSMRYGSVGCLRRRGRFPPWGRAGQLVKSRKLCCLLGSTARRPASSSRPPARRARSFLAEVTRPSLSRARAALRVSLSLSESLRVRARARIGPDVSPAAGSDCLR